MQTLVLEIVGYIAVSALLGLILGYLIWGFRARARHRRLAREVAIERRNQRRLEREVEILRREIIGITAERDAARAMSQRPPATDDLPPPEPLETVSSEPLAPPPRTRRVRVAEPEKTTVASSDAEENVPARETSATTAPADEREQDEASPAKRTGAPDVPEPVEAAPPVVAPEPAPPVDASEPAPTAPVDEPIDTAAFEPERLAETERVDLDDYTDEEGPSRLREAVETLQEELGVTATEGETSGETDRASVEDSASLVRIRGIGKATAARLNEAGVNSTDELAAMTDEELRGLARDLDRPILTVADWAEQARAL